MVYMGCETGLKTIGPWGGPGGDYFDDGTYDGVREITLKSGDAIDSMQITYEKNCKPVVVKHGGGGGQHTHHIKLQFPCEFLTAVMGRYAPLSGNYGNSYIRSLTFKTNLRTYGPFGVDEGTPFSSPIEGGKIVGFIGRSGWYFDAIGVHMRQS